MIDTKMKKSRNKVKKGKKKNKRGIMFNLEEDILAANIKKLKKKYREQRRLQKNKLDTLVEINYDNEQDSGEEN